MEKRMYFIVPYNISEIQKSIQSGHAAEQFAAQFQTDEWKDYVNNHKTWIVLNGGTTNNNPERYGTLQLHRERLKELNVNYAEFYEPDLNDALTAVCFIADERIFNHKDYPFFNDWAKDKIDLYLHTKINQTVISSPYASMLLTQIANGDLLKEAKDNVRLQAWNEYCKFIGSENIAELKEFLSQFKLA